MRTAEVIASRILFWGGVLSILFMTLGIVGFVARGRLDAADPPAIHTSLAEVARAWREWPVEPLAVVTTGILLLLATPFVGVVAVFVVFAVRGDRRYAGIAAVLIAALLVSVAVINR